MSTNQNPDLNGRTPDEERVKNIARVALVIGAVACLAFSFAPAWGLVAGVCIALILGNPSHTLTGGGASMILKIAVVLLGAGMNLGTVWRVGASGVVYTMAGIVFTLGFGLWLGRRTKLSRDAALLISTGTAICGGSAIAAMSAAIKPKAHDVAVAMAAVFLLNAAGLVVFPWVGHALGFSQEQFGMWAALAIHDTSSVAGAAAGYGAVALSIAVTVKLTRALWIVPLTAIVSWRRARRDGENDGSENGGVKGVGRFLPQPFILGYLMMAAVFTYVPGLAGGDIAGWCGVAAHRLMTLALFLIGAGLSREALRRAGARPLGMAVVLWVVVSVATAGAVLAGWIVAPV